MTTPAEYRKRTHEQHTMLRKQLRDYIIANPGQTRDQIVMAVGEDVWGYARDLQQRKLIRWTKPQRSSHIRARWYAAAMEPPAYEQHPLAESMKFVERRQALSLLVPACPFCKESKQVQLTFWLRPPAAWKCRQCKRSWTEEPVACVECEDTKTVKTGEGFRPCPKC